jgi:hypothetical protein
VLIQEREASLRLIRQHDHALLAGALASMWRTEDRASLPIRTVLASALHDAVWREEDRAPRFDPVRGRPFDFITVPVERKRIFVEEGVRALVALDPGVAALVQAHHEALAEGFEVDPGSQLAWVRLFDNLSLLACLTAPGSLVASRPRWLSARFPPPEGPELSASWRGDALVLSAAPFDGPLAYALPYRDLPRVTYRDSHDLQEAWEAAPEQELRVEIVSGVG